MTQGFARFIPSDSLAEEAICRTSLVREGKGIQKKPKLISHLSDSDGCEIQLLNFAKAFVRPLGQVEKMGAPRKAFWSSFRRSAA